MSYGKIKAAVILCLLTQVPNNSFGGPVMRSTNPNMEFRNTVGFDEAVQSEPVDGLILMDVRTIPPPFFFEKWAEKGWSFSFAGGYYSFGSMAVGRSGDVEIDISVFSNYEGARQKFLSSAVTSRVPYPWTKCSKNFGTVCTARAGNPKGHIFFIYRNIFISIYNNFSNDTITGQTAEWFFDVLKNFPRSPMDAPFKLRDSIDNNPKALYDEAVKSEPLKSEPVDGLILTDIRMIEGPTFVDKWAEKGWNYSSGKDHYSLGWKVVWQGDEIDVGLETFSSYEAARKAFFQKTVATFAPYPWQKSEFVGTLCAEHSEGKKISLFFVYRNVLLSTSSRGRDVGAFLQTTEWLFKVLEDSPRSPMGAPFVLHGPKGKVP